MNNTTACYSPTSCFHEVIVIKVRSDETAECSGIISFKRPPACPSARTRQLLQTLQQPTSAALSASRSLYCSRVTEQIFFSAVRHWWRDGEPQHKEAE